MAAGHNHLSPTANHVDWHQIQGVISYLQAKTSIRPKIGVICGSGLGGLADQLDTDKPIDKIPYEEIGLPKCSGKLSPQHDIYITDANNYYNIFFFFISPRPCWAVGVWVPGGEGCGLHAGKTSLL